MVTKFLVQNEYPFDYTPDTAGTYFQEEAFQESNRRKAIWKIVQDTQLLREANPDEIVRLQGIFFEGNILIAKKGYLPGREVGTVAGMESGGTLITWHLDESTYWLSCGFAETDMNEYCKNPTGHKMISETHMRWLSKTVKAIREGQSLPSHNITWASEDNPFEVHDWPFWYTDSSV